MARRVIFTESQLKHIMGENAFNCAYNDMYSHGSEYPSDSLEVTDSEVMPTEPSDSPIMPTTDKYGAQKTSNHPWMRRAYYGLYEGDRKKKVLTERNKELDGKKIFSLPKELRKFARPNGMNDDIIQRLGNGDKFSIEELYRIRKEIENNPNKEIRRGVNQMIQQAQMQGSLLRNGKLDVQYEGIPDERKGRGTIGKSKHKNKIYYEF